MTYDPIDLNRMFSTSVPYADVPYRPPSIFLSKRTVAVLREVWPSQTLASMRKGGWRWDGRLYMRKRHNKIGRTQSSTKFLDSIITV